MLFNSTIGLIWWGLLLRTAGDLLRDAGRWGWEKETENRECPVSSLGARITDIHHHAWFIQCCGWNSGFHAC